MADVYETRLSDVVPSARIELSGTPGKKWILWPRTKAASDIERGIVFARLSAENTERWLRGLGARLPTLAEATAAAASGEAIVLAFVAWPNADTMRSAAACAWWDARLKRDLGYEPRAQPVFAGKFWLALSPWAPPDGRPPPRPASQRSENWGAWKRDGRPAELYQPGGWGSQDHDRLWTDYSQIPRGIID